MALEVYYPADIRNALLAALEAINALFVFMGMSERAGGFMTGYKAALVTIALAFGLIEPLGKEAFAALLLGEEQ